MKWKTLFFFFFAIANLLVAIILDWGKMVVSDWFLIIRWVVQSPFRNWDLLRNVVWFREGIAPGVWSVVGNRLQCVFLHHLVCNGDKVIIDSACWFRWVFICPVDIFVISCNERKNIWMMFLKISCNEYTKMGIIFEMQIQWICDCHLITISSLFTMY